MSANVSQTYIYRIASVILLLFCSGQFVMCRVATFDDKLTIL